MVAKREEEIHRTQPGCALVQEARADHQRLREDSFFVAERGVRHATPLFVVLLLSSFSDLIFAVDSIPAISR